MQGIEKKLDKAYHGKSAQELADAPVDALLRSVEHAIVFIDEVDKIRASVGNAPSVRGIVAQEALLTLMENENVEFDVDGQKYSVNSSGVRASVGVSAASAGRKGVVETVIRIESR